MERDVKNVSLSSSINANTIDNTPDKNILSNTNSIPIPRIIQSDIMLPSI